jgi:glycosyltransferase involved in cell wall biosynthesis
MHPLAFLREWRTAQEHRRVRDTYAAIIVASEHMRREFVRNGAAPSRVRTNPLFPTERIEASLSTQPDEPHVVFLGRMTPLKGGDLLIRAVHHAATRLSRSVRLTMVGDGPARGEWEQLAAGLGVPCAFTGWKAGAERWPIVQSASIVAVPSVWPEPFGLVGLEAGALGIPAIAVNVGGIGEWLRDGVNGVAVAAPATPASFGSALADVLASRARLAALGEGAYRTAHEMTLDRHVDRLEEVFSSC